MLEIGGKPRPGDAAAERLDDEAGRGAGRGAHRGGRELMGAVDVGAGGPQHLELVHAGLHEDHRALRVAAFQCRGRAFASQQRRHHRGIHNPPHQRVVSIDLHADVAASRCGRDFPERGLGIGQFRRRAE